MDFGRNQRIQEAVKSLPEGLCVNGRGYRKVRYLLGTGGEATEQDIEDFIVPDGKTRER